MALVMRRKVRDPFGRWAHVPIVTGDSMRHGIREAASYQLLDAIGLLGAHTLTESMLRFLFAGGMISGKRGPSIKLDDYRTMVDLIPHLGLMGGCAQNRMVPGRLWVDDAVLICSETRHILPEWVTDWMFEHRQGYDSCRSHIEEATRVRMDPSLDPAKRRLLREEEVARVEARLTSRETAGEEEDDEGKAESKSSMMPRTHECVTAGSLFYWSVTGHGYSDLDWDVYQSCIQQFCKHIRIGGKRGTGHGQLSALVTYPPGAMATTSGELLARHISERSDQIRDWLRRVDA